MFNFYKSFDGQRIAELNDINFLVSSPDEFLDLIGNLGSQDCGMLILHEKNLHPDFFDLKTKLAGEILQKCSNYHFSIAIIGDFSKYNSKSLRDFIYESNKGKLVTFNESFESALNRLSS
jgi:hypothetical protein